MAQSVAGDINAHTPPSSVPLSAFETTKLGILSTQMRELTQTHNEDPPFEEIEQILEVLELPADVKRYLFELATLAEQVRKWERETETFAQSLAATADSALTREQLATVLAEAGVVGDKEAEKMEDISSA